VIFGAPHFDPAPEPDGEVVTLRRATFGSQPEQIRFLRTLVDGYRTMNSIRQRARDVVFRQYGCKPKDHPQHALALGSWVHRNITYVQEIPEVFQTPITTLLQKYGDCDDFTTLICAMLESVGIESELVGMEWAGADGVRSFRHIFPVARVMRRGGLFKIPLDATICDPIEGNINPVAVAVAKGAKVRLYVS
jgi:transglutaminase-like putative cysteine protease